MKNTNDDHHEDYKDKTVVIMTINMIKLKKKVIKMMRMKKLNYEEKYSENMWLKWRLKDNTYKLLVEEKDKTDGQSRILSLASAAL